jgi:pimeloyl-ACP methyl ester carboxylesterase
VRKLPATVTGLALVAALVTAAPTLGAARSVAAAAPSSVATAATLHWTDCSSIEPGLVGTGTQCAVLKVPMDYNHPGGPKVSLAVSRLRHTSSAKNYQGVLMLNPGGPGAGGLDLPVYEAAAVPGTVAGDYDWVSWDPRGVGASKPTIRCDRHYFKAPRRSYVPRTKQLLHYWLARSKAYAAACERKYPRLLNNMTTIDSARDMNAIREALGVARISFYGFSYGTYLGQVYSTMYPTHLRRMVLDSTVNPHAIWYRANLNQDRAMNHNIELFFRWVAKHHRYYHLGAAQKSVSARYYRDLAQLTKHPQGRLGPDEWADAFLSAGYYQSTWTSIADAWVSYDLHGHANPMVDLFRQSDEPGDDNEYAVYEAVQCTDTQWPTSWAKWRADNHASYRKYPFLTWGNAWYNAPCLTWGGKAHRPLRIKGAATKSVLMVDETLDGATPYSGSLAVRKLYPNASLIAEPGGTTHADSLSGDTCVDNAIARYLKTGHRPSRKQWNGPDKLCRPLGAPGPNQSFLTPSIAGP